VGVQQGCRPAFRWLLGSRHIDHQKKKAIEGFRTYTFCYEKHYTWYAQQISYGMKKILRCKAHCAGVKQLLSGYEFFEKRYRKFGNFYSVSYPSICFHAFEFLFVQTKIRNHENKLKGTKQNSKVKNVEGMKFLQRY
jgi:hypothetical protein